MCIRCCMLVVASELSITCGASLLAQTESGDGNAPSNLLVKVQQIERRIDGLESRQSETTELLKTILRKLERPDATPSPPPTTASEGLRFMGTSPTDNRWRYKFHQGRWWYWRPNEEWLYWSDNHWVALRPPSPVAAKVVEDPPSFEQADGLSSSSATADHSGSSTASSGDLQQDLRKVTQALTRLEKQVQRQAAAQALLVRGQTALIDRFQRLTDEAATAGEVLERKREQNQRDLVGVE